MNVQKKLSSFKKKFDQRLSLFLDSKISQAKKIDPKTLALTSKIKDFALRGGKRIRPALLDYGFKACGGKNEEIVFPCCLAVELFHIMALIHDDIIDKSDFRRGGPTIHKFLGIPGAILAGDLCFSWADEVFEGKARKYWELLKEEVILGQYLERQLALEFCKKSIRSSHFFAKLEPNVFKIYEYKTAYYSIVRPLQIGAALAGGGKKDLKVLENYGLPLGIAFQVKDDILGMFGEEKIIGKPVDSDLKEGKMTLLIVRTISKLKAQSSKLKITRQNLKLKRFLFLLGNKNASKKDLEWVRDLIKETGALNYCQKRAKKLAEKAKKAIKDYPFEAKAKEFLLGIADFLITRKY